MVKLLVAKDYEELSELCTKEFVRCLQTQATPKLGLATGSTPIGTYERLVELNRRGEIDFSSTTTVNLDEYMDLPPSNEQSYHYFMHHHLFDHINIPRENIHIPEVDRKTADEDIKAYDKILDKVGRRHIQLLGVGVNGHIAFNEPNRRQALRTNITELTEETIKSNSRFFDSIDEVPTKAISMGIGDIMNSDQIILIANGENKHWAIKTLLESDFVDFQYNPATILKLHPNLLIICDEACYNG